ncbi:MAG: FG-GAP-like repeat-containing protein, partial [Bacteroidales bacterium]|nr:FG-GAP-like repeat-containing protein [Bacteroidales bacterium]
YIEELFTEIDFFPFFLPMVFSSLSRPHFVDVDGDGDLDMLVFGGMSGTSLYFYKNRSVENFGRTDTFDFILSDRMWGCFREGDTSNEIILNTCPPNTGISAEFILSKVEGLNDRTCSLSEVERYISIVPLHGEGSTIFAFDFNTNGVFDLLLADGGYPGITALFNGGSPTDAIITHFDANFPRKSTPVNILNTPTVSTIHIDNSGTKSLIFSPFDVREFSTESYASIWVYKNMSPSGDADFQLINKRFLQEDMLDFGMGSFPAIVDIDGNGLLDIVVGNHGKIDSVWHSPVFNWEARFLADLVLLRNIGTKTEPAFQVYSLKLTPPLDVAGAVPTFGDIDNDGHLDLLIGTACGKILHYRNRYSISANVFPPHFELVNPNILEDVAWNNNTVGDPLQGNFTFLAPQLFDVNGNGLLDLVVGSRYTVWFDTITGRPYSKSSVTYFENTGTPENPIFTFVTDSLGRIDVTRQWAIAGDTVRDINGSSQPHFFRDASGNAHLFCGNEEGRVLHFTDIDGNLYGTFQRMEDIRFLLNDRVEILCEGSFTSVAVADLNGDGILDLVVGNHRGGLTIFFGISEFPPTNIERPAVETHERSTLQLFPNPVQDWLFIQLDDHFHQMRGEILDIQGRTIRHLPNVQNGQSIDVSWLPTGIYIFRIFTANQIFTQKFIKN